MKTFSFDKVDLSSGYLFDKQELNRKTTIYSVYDRFDDTGRIGAFSFNYKEGDKIKPHVFWDSDVAKWIEGASYIIQKHPTPELERKIDDLVEKIKKNQDENGYFNIYFTVCEPNARFTRRGDHELYCAGHLMEAAVAYDKATGKSDFLTCMEKYSDHISRAFIEEKTASFASPGHEEIELALVRMYLHTGKKKYLDMASHFINIRGSKDDTSSDAYSQAHKPVREQTEAVGHSVRAMYLYTGMAYLAAETKDAELIAACKTLWEDTVLRKMYVTGGIGSSSIGETFTNPYDLPSDQAYTETCAGIGLMFFSNAMLAFENDSRYADTVERALYNGVLSGLSLDGRSFFYENPLEINLSEHFENSYGKRRFPITQRVECFNCSCCPPNINRLLPSLGNYVYGFENDTLFVNQYISSKLCDDGIACKQETSYPNDGEIRISAKGVKYVALRIPAWCNSFSLSKPYTMKNGYAIVENDGNEIVLSLDIKVRAVWADPRVIRDAGRVCIMLGPVVYCAESVDNGENLHSFLVPEGFSYTEKYDESFGLHTLEISCKKRLNFELAGGIYSDKKPRSEKANLKLIPYNSFANRGESDMLVWLCAEE